MRRTTNLVSFFGMSLAQRAAMNLDGGESTEMVLKGDRAAAHREYAHIGEQRSAGWLRAQWRGGELSQSSRLMRACQTVVSAESFIGSRHRRRERASGLWALVQTWIEPKSIDVCVVDSE